MPDNGENLPQFTPLMQVIVDAVMHMPDTVDEFINPAAFTEINDIFGGLSDWTVTGQARLDEHRLHGDVTVTYSQLALEVPFVQPIDMASLPSPTFTDNDAGILHTQYLSAGNALDATVEIQQDGAYYMAALHSETPLTTAYLALNEISEETGIAYLLHPEDRETSTNADGSQVIDIVSAGDSDRFPDRIANFAEAFIRYSNL